MNNYPILLEYTDQNTLYFNTGWFMISPILSSLASAFVITASIAFKMHKSPMGIMILGINLANFVFSLTRSVGPLMKSNTSCKISAFVAGFSLNVSFVWGAMFGHALMMTVKHRGTHILQKLIKWYVPISLLLPLILLITSIIQSRVRYDETKGACMSESDSHTYALRRVLPLSLGVILSYYWYLSAICKLRRIMAQRNTWELWTLMIFPLIVLACWGPYVTAQIIYKIEFGSGADRSLVCRILRSFAHLQGFFDALVYGRSVNMIGMLCQKCKKKTHRREEIVSLEKLGQSSSTKVNIGFDESGVESMDEALVRTHNNSIY